MKLGISSAPLGRRRVPAWIRARERDARIDRLRIEAESITLAPWTPPVVIRVRARRGLP